MSDTQTAYIKDKFTEIALHTIVCHYKIYASVAFLDIKGVFNNVDLQSVIEAFIKLKIDKTKISLIIKLKVSFGE